MCTIGAKSSDGFLAFKQRDLKTPSRVEDLPPELREGRRRYLAFSSKGRRGCWAGVNDKGLVAVTATARVNPSGGKRGYGSYLLNEELLSNCASVDEAKALFLSSPEHFEGHTLFLLASPEKALVIERKDGELAFEEQARDYLVLRTNAYRKLDFPCVGSDIPARFERATALFKKNSTLPDVQKMLRDHANGPSESSICVHGARKKTVSSVVFAVGEGIKAYYVLNKNPCEGEYGLATL